MTADRAGEDHEASLIIKGKIEESSVPELLRTVLGSGETGILTFRNSGITKSIHLHKGQVVYAQSTNPDERLGEILLLRGKITARQYFEASKRIGPGRRLGGILVELGALEPEELLPAVEQHVKEILMDLFAWTHGEYQLVMNEPGDDVVTLKMSTLNLILEGIRRTRSWSLVLRGIGSIETVLFPTGSEALYRLDLADEEQEVLSHVNGRSTVEQICQVSYLSNFETCRILWALSVLGVVRRGQVGEVAASGEGQRQREGELDLEEVVEKFNQMFSRIYAFLRGRLGESVDEFMERAMADVALQYGVLFSGIDLKNYGRADYDQMLANVADLPPDQRRGLMLAGLNELVLIMQLAVRTERGAQEEAVVSGIIRDGFRRLGAA
jgi:Domain of unknown function (DUF4388)